MLVNVKNTVNVDVCVIGGGTAGCFAAMSAAAAGAKTILIEKNGSLGGTITLGGVNFPGLFYAWGKQIIKGFAWDAVLRTCSLTNTKLPEFKYKSERHWHEQIRINGFDFAHILHEMCYEKGAEVLLHSMLAYAVEHESGIKLLIACKDGLTLINAKKAIDATSDADLVKMLGYPIMKSDILQPSTLAVYLTGYDKASLNREQILDQAKAAKTQGKLPDYILATDPYKCLEKGYTDIHIKTPPNADTSFGKTNLEYTAKKNVLELIQFIRTISGCENTRAHFYFGECGVRETCRVIGNHIITADEYISGKLYDDAICYAFYPIDLHNKSGIKQVHLEPETVPTIPLSALTVKNSNHIFAVGRIISSDTDANSALRVQAPCMASGQAAGAAAAICAKDNIDTNKIKIQKVTAELLKQGAIVPSSH